MNQFVIAIMAMMMVLSGCASSGGTSLAVENNGGLPEIAPYDEATYEPLPDMAIAQ